MVSKTPLQIITGVLNVIHPNNYEIIPVLIKDSVTKIKPFFNGVVPLNMSEFEVLIRYPELEITNSFGYKHKLLDLFILLKFVKNKLVVFKGFRTTVTFKEHLNLYQHSHLSNHTHDDLMTDFCIGADSTDFGIIYKQSKKEVFTVETFTLFLYSLRNYLQWESIEGGPYKEIFALDYVSTSTNFTKLNLPDEFKDELYNCVVISDNTINKCIDVQLEVSPRLDELIPNEYKIIVYRKRTWIKKHLPVEVLSEQHLFRTNNFDIKYKIIKSTNVEGIIGNTTKLPNEFIEAIETQLTFYINNLLLWKK